MLLWLRYSSISIACDFQKTFLLDKFYEIWETEGDHALKNSPLKYMHIYGRKGKENPYNITVRILTKGLKYDCSKGKKENNIFIKTCI